MKAHKYWSIGALITMLGTFYTGYRGSKEGHKYLSTKYTGLRAMGSYSGNIAYCIEPGTGQRTGDTLTEKDENFFNNISPNGTISGDDIRLLIGRILQYGYRGGIRYFPHQRI